MTKVSSLGTQYEIKFPRSSNDMRFYDRIFTSFLRTYGGKSFEKRKCKKKIFEDMEGDDLVEPTLSDWSGPLLFVPQKMEPITWLKTIAV